MAYIQNQCPVVTAIAQALSGGSKQVRRILWRFWDLIVTQLRFASISARSLDFAAEDAWENDK